MPSISLEDRPTLYTVDPIFLCRPLVLVWGNGCGSLLHNHTLLIFSVREEIQTITVYFVLSIFQETGELVREVKVICSSHKHYYSCRFCHMQLYAVTLMMFHEDIYDVFICTAWGIQS